MACRCIILGFVNRRLTVIFGFGIIGFSSRQINTAHSGWFRINSVASGHVEMEIIGIGFKIKLLIIDG